MFWPNVGSTIELFLGLVFLSRYTVLRVMVGVPRNLRTSPVAWFLFLAILRFILYFQYMLGWTSKKYRLFMLALANSITLLGWLMLAAMSFVKIYVQFTVNRFLKLLGVIFIIAYSLGIVMNFVDIFQESDRLQLTEEQRLFRFIIVQIGYVPLFIISFILLRKVKETVTLFIRRLAKFYMLCTVCILTVDSIDLLWPKAFDTEFRYFLKVFLKSQLPLILVLLVLRKGLDPSEEKGGMEGKGKWLLEEEIQ